MEVIFLLLIAMLGLAFAAGAGTYHLSHYKLVKAGNKNAKLVSWFLSLCSFAAVIVIVYFILLYNLRIER